MTTCPSGVNYMHLVDHARSYIERTYRRPLAERWLRSLLGAVLPRPGLFRLALAGARLVRPLGRWIPGRSMTAQRMRAMLTLSPSEVPSPGMSGKACVYPAQGPRKARVALMTGCAQQVLMPRINEATIRLLTRLGVEVVVAKGAGCCGALNHHIGQHDRAMALARANIEAWSVEGPATSGLDAIIINASGCGTTVKDYGFMFRSEPEPWRTASTRIAAMTLDVTQFLARFGYTPTREPPGLTVAYHSACSLQHGQQVTIEPKALLSRAGFRVVEPREPHICCGSAGTYNILQPEIAGRLRDRKLGNLKALRPDLIAAGNIGCITQLSGETVPVVHTVELLDWMSGGPPPPGFSG
jgi:glycolate oxidase iron-sulfur subunit